MKIEINSNCKIGYKKISEAEKGNTSGNLSHIGIGASLDGIPMKKDYKCFLYFDNKISEHATHLKLSAEGGSPMIQGAECIIKKIKYSSLYNEIRSIIDVNQATKEWILVWTIDKEKQLFFTLMRSDSSDYALLSASFPKLSKLGKVPKLISRNESEFNVVMDYLNNKFFQSQSNFGKNYWLFFDCDKTFELLGKYEYAMIRSSINNPKIGDEIALFDQDKYSIIGRGEIVSSEKRIKYKKDTLGRSNTSDKISFYIVEFIISELNEIPLENRKKEIEEIEEIKTHPTGHKQKISEKLFKFLKNFQIGKKLHLNQILYGPPGTGKTFNVINEALAIVDPEFDTTSNTEDERRKVVAKFNEYKSEGRISFITFHQSYSYEDFVLGIMPDVDNEHLKFNRKEGVFYRIVKKAKNDKDKLPYVLVIDEINRANISRVFGELITLIEVDKRLGAVNELTVELPNEKVDIDAKTGKEIVKEFGVPSNLYLLGTMNTADKSIAALDIALRRRFTFKAYYPDKTKIVDPNLRKFMEELNKNMESNDKFYKGSDFTIGHSYFMNKTIKDCSEIFNGSVIPLLLEYYMNDIETVKELLKTIKLDPFYENGTIKIS